MRVLLLADIHSNLTALQAVVFDAETRGSLDAVWCLGDMVGYGPDPVECLEQLRAMGALCIAGNHDLAATGRVPLSAFNTHAAAACAWTATRLDEDCAAWLRRLPLGIQTEERLLVHGSPRDAVWEYLVSPDEAKESFDLITAPLCLVGHTHLPAVFEMREGGECTRRTPVPGESVPIAGRRIIFNPGSVGQPRDGDPRACYAVYEGGDETITHYRVEYHIPAVQRRMERAGLPAYLIARLARGR